MSEKFSFEDKFLNDLYSKTGEIYSIIEVPEGHGLNPDLLENKPKFTPFYVDGKFYEGKTIPLVAVYKTESNYYLYLYKKDWTFASYNLKIYYTIKIQKEVLFFINNLKKLKNGNQ